MTRRRHNPLLPNAAYEAARLGVKGPDAHRHGVPDRSATGEAVREALKDSQSTLSAIKAECIARTEQKEDQMASHIAEICQITMLTNAAALSQSTAGEDGA